MVKGMIPYKNFQELELRVAEIVEAKEHPGADKLYVLIIDIAGEKRQIVAGIRASYKVEELIGKKVIVIANLEPAVIRGEVSNGMLLAASSPLCPTCPILITPEKDIPSGAIVK
ncbi:methionyl-tRNA synthetase [Candidatus Omnitrophus magneticus]|uniref:Methionyl-tRNA synthetase n=1 Tax=Candidatus Omnitrophus magneticus TaxID=1609969 RepID=A0A0F0CQZ5_9BACT|nr:methionyl-tRNA synthetase [Candidatus Omnitrophus magneticus]